MRLESNVDGIYFCSISVFPLVFIPPASHLASSADQDDESFKNASGVAHESGKFLSQFRGRCNV